MQATFTLATPDDLETLLVFIREFCEFDQHPYDEETLRPTLDTLLRDHSLGRVWLIQHGAVPIGYVVLAFGYSLEYRGRDAFVDEVYMREDHRRQGVGTQTFAFLEQACRSLGVRALHLEFEQRNTAAQRFYYKSGFYDQERHLMTKLISAG